MDDGSCLILGCTNIEACNYDSFANEDFDGLLCVFNEEYYDCEGNCLIDQDGDGVCDNLEILGCSDQSAINYNYLVTEDDGSCIILGCLDVNALNYNPNANTDFGGLLCIYEEDLLGCLDPDAFNYNPNATIDSGICFIFGCTDESACNYENNATEDFNGLLCTFPEQYYDCDGNCINDSDGDDICDELEILGCLNTDAWNYNPNATDDSGYCIITGCMDEEACNYNSEATEDFEGLLCIYPEFDLIVMVIVFCLKIVI